MKPRLSRTFASALATAVLALACSHDAPQAAQASQGAASRAVPSFAEPSSSTPSSSAPSSSAPSSSAPSAAVPDAPAPSPEVSNAAAQAGVAPQSAAAARAEFEAGAAPAGALEGLVLFDGEPPARVAINTSAEGGCGFDPKAPPLTEAWVVERARFANVFVWLENPPAGAEQTPLPAEPAVLHQRGCIYRPHALALRKGTTLRITNEDRARHNVRAVARRDGNPGFNTNQPEGAPPYEVVFGAAEVAIPIVCDLHPWMKAWVGVFDHPWYTLTGADGRFTFAGLPPGEYHVRTWHEVLGRQTATVTVGASAGARVALVYRKKD